MEVVAGPQAYDPADPLKVRDLARISSHYKRQQRQDDTRHRIAITLVVVYLALVAAQISVAVYFSETASPERIDNLKSIMEAMGTPVAGLTGLVGFVLGFYFKSSDGTDDGSTS